MASRLTFKPEDGLEVIATGKITTFAGKSSYQLVIDSLEIAGTGALLKLLEERKQKFAAEGLFDQAHKQKIPFLPDTIGVITSASGAVIRDIIHRVTDRFPSHILLWPAPVRGEGAAEKIAAAIEGMNNLPTDGPVKRPDVLIVARGGGSLEDLWPFNEEIVIRAVYNSRIPLISAVGHETDTMLIDYVSDLRAPTPYRRCRICRSGQSRTAGPHTHHPKPYVQQHDTLPQRTAQSGNRLGTRHSQSVADIAGEPAKA